MSLSRDDYDSPWKEAIERYLPEFLAFFFTTVHAAIDWSKGHVFLDQELRQVVREAAQGRRTVDKLVQVFLVTGGEEWILIHIEIQGYREETFAKRVLVCNYRIFDRCDHPVVSLVVLADETQGWRPSSFAVGMLGCRLSLDFVSVKLLDWVGHEDELLQEDNPFALVTAAHLLTQRTKDAPQARHAAKRMLVRLLYQRNWDRQRVLDLFAVLDWMMHIPDELNRQLWQEIETLEEEQNMRYVTSVERIGIEKGIEQGIEQGIEKGIEQGIEKGIEKGRVEGKAETLLRLLRVRHGALASDVETRIQTATSEQLDAWIERFVSARSLTEVFTPPH